MALVAINAAIRRISVKDFDLECQMSQASAGESYHDRLRVAEQLLEDGFIFIEDGRLRVNYWNIPDWLCDGLKTGEESSWLILDLLETQGSVAGKVDQLLLQQIGFDGELAVMDALKEALPAHLYQKVKHVSLHNDSAGFDIATPTAFEDNGIRLLEVKTCARPSTGFIFYISRNEARVASQNHEWRLIGVQSKSKGFEIVGHLSFSSFQHLLPSDNSPDGRWETAKIIVQRNQFEKHLPL